jgi:hypothetical protein
VKILPALRLRFCIHTHTHCRDIQARALFGRKEGAQREKRAHNVPHLPGAFVLHPHLPANKNVSQRQIFRFPRAWKRFSVRKKADLADFAWMYIFTADFSCWNKMCYDKYLN